MREPQAHLRPVGTGGGREEGWGPCACPSLPYDSPGFCKIRYFVDEGKRITRQRWTGTRPPPPPNPAPCPYRTGATIRDITRYGWSSPVQRDDTDNMEGYA